MALLLAGLQELLIIVGAVLGIALLSSIEAALLGLPAPRVQLARERKQRNAHHLEYWIKSPARVLVTLYLVRVALVLGVAVAAHRLLSRAAVSVPEAVVVAVIAVGLVFVSHLVPRVVAKGKALEWALATIRLVRVACVLLWPVVAPMLALTKVVGEWLGARPKRSGGLAFWTPDEVGALAAEARVDVAGAASRELFRSIIEFSDTVVSEVMVPRTDMVAVAVDSSEQEVRGAAIEAGHSRIPVYEETIDNILGLLNVKDLSTGGGKVPVFELRRLLRPTFYVPEVMKISELLREFQRRKTHMAIVVDEYGGTAGLVTLEDVIEEIVGEIQDEFDVEEKQFRVLGDGKIIADGRVRLWDLERPLGVNFPENGDYETLAGFVTARAGFLPPAATVVKWNGLVFTIKEADEKRVRTVEIERRAGESALRK